MNILKEEIMKKLVFAIALLSSGTLIINAMTPDQLDAQGPLGRRLRAASYQRANPPAVTRADEDEMTGQENDAVTGEEQDVQTEEND